MVCHSVTDDGDELVCEGELCLTDRERGEFAADASVACRRCLRREYGYAAVKDTHPILRQRQLAAEPPWICPRCVAAVLPVSVSPLPLSTPQLPPPPPDAAAAAAACADALRWFQDPDLLMSQDEFDWLFTF